jgi:hypothetical protein
VDGEAEEVVEEAAAGMIRRLLIVPIRGRDIVLGRRDGGLVSGVVRWEARQRGIWRDEDRDSRLSLCRTTMDGLGVVVGVALDRRDQVGVDRVVLVRDRVPGMRVRALGLRLGDRSVWKGRVSVQSAVSLSLIG